MALHTKPFYAFGPFRLDSARRVLVREGTPVPLAPKVAETLVVLVENAGHLVDKDDLMKRVWPDAFVEEGNLNKNIFFLRKVLGEWDGGREYIETIPKRGFRFIAPVTEVTHAEGAPQPQTSTGASLIGKKVSHYRVLEIIGGGGMGLVYKAEDLKLGRRVALKFLPEELATDSLTLQRFEREARTASSLNHPNICTIYEFGEREGQPFIVMELLEGETLRDRLASSAAKAVPLNQILDIAIQTCDGLQAAHQKGIIHRDIKPANIFLIAQGPVKILDFGLAKLAVAGEVAAGAVADGGQPTPIQSVIPSAEQSEASRYPYRTNEPESIGVPRLASQMSGRSLGMTPDRKDGGLQLTPVEMTLTRTGLAMGTAGYMSPEQVRGEKLDARTDIFSFGLVLYEMATGQRAFTGETAAIVHDAILQLEPRSAREFNAKLTSKLGSVIDKCLQKDRDLRYQHAAQIAAELHRLDASRRASWRRWLIAIAGSILTVLGAVVTWFFYNRPVPRPEIKLRQLTFSSSENSVRSGAISPDGKSLAYIDQKGAHMTPLGTGVVQQLHLPAAMKDSPDWQFAQWFPDGTKILGGLVPMNESYSLEQNPSIWVFPLAGAFPRKLRDDAVPSSISRDGSWIAFDTTPGLFGNRAIWIMKPNGEDAKKLLESDENSATFGAQWSEDGKRLLYLKVDKSGVGIETRDLRGGPDNQVAVFTDGGLTSLLWLPDGRLVYAVMERSTNEYTCNFWAVRLDPRSGQKLGQPTRLTNWTGYCIDIQGSTADGKQIVFRQWTAQHNIYVADLKPDGTLTPPRQLTPTKFKNYVSAWTPDSKAVIFATRRTGTWGIYKQSIENEEPETVVTSLPGYGVYMDHPALPQVTPDGKWVLYTIRPDENDLASLANLMRVPVEGGLPERILSGNIYGPPSCANLKVGICVIAEQKDGGNSLLFLTVDPLNGRTHELTSTMIKPKGNYVWALSPDGTRVALLDKVGGPIHVLWITGERPAREVKVRDWASLDSVAWAADAKSLFVSVHNRREAELLRVDLRSNSQLLWKQEGGYGTYAIPSPDGRRLAIKSWTLDSNIWMMENF
jgi:eukaryotic-like serine/threonine-protein kinase